MMIARFLVFLLFVFTGGMASATPPSPGDNAQTMFVCKTEETGRELLSVVGMESEKLLFQQKLEAYLASGMCVPTGHVVVQIKSVIDMKKDTDGIMVYLVDLQTTNGNVYYTMVIYDPKKDVKT